MIIHTLKMCTSCLCTFAIFSVLGVLDLDIFHMKCLGGVWLDIIALLGAWGSKQFLHYCLWNLLKCKTFFTVWK